MSENYYDGTSGTYPLSMPDTNSAYSVTLRPINETVSTPAMLRPSAITGDAYRVVSAFENREMAEVAEKLMRAIDQTLQIYEATGGNLDAIRPVRATLPEDGSIAMEWTNPDFRIGFNIETNPADSGWYLVTSQRLGEIGVHGQLASIEPASLASLAVNFLRANT
jgi:hypothetical protein